MFFKVHFPNYSQKKPYSAVTVAVDNLTSKNYAKDDISGIPGLVEVIRIQPTGPTEASRVIRRKLKYGNVHGQIRALVLLDELIQHAGSEFPRCFSDSSLIEQLRFCRWSEFSDQSVQKKCITLFHDWSQYRATPGLEKLARLYQESPGAQYEKYSMAAAIDMHAFLKPDHGEKYSARY